MTITKITGSSHGGIYSIFIDLFENVSDILLMPVTAVQIPIREGSASWSQDVGHLSGGKHYDLKMQGFCAGLKADNMDAFEGYNDRRIIVWFTDYHAVNLVAGTLEHPCRISVSNFIPGDVKQASGISFEIAGRQTEPVSVIPDDFSS